MQKHEGSETDETHPEIPFPAAAVVAEALIPETILPPGSAPP
jgi:hypothetical protein